MEEKEQGLLIKDFVKNRLKVEQDLQNRIDELEKALEDKYESISMGVQHIKQFNYEAIPIQCAYEIPYRFVQSTPIDKDALIDNMKMRCAENIMNYLLENNLIEFVIDKEHYTANPHIWARLYVYKK